ncbi:MAG: OmpA family protein, partial [Bradymonadia bacterium]
QQTDHRFSLELDGYLPTSDNIATQSGLSAGIGYALAMYENWQLGTQLHTALSDSFGLPAHQTIITLGYRHLTHRRPPRCVNEHSYLHDDRCDPPDSDQDGVFDPDDRCPTVPEDRDGFEDEDGCPDPDNDQDKILDGSDKCPNEAEDFDEFEDEDGCPDPDNDQDGIPDETDKCPLEPETKNGFDDEDGCPEPDDDKDGIPNANDRCPSEAEDVDGFQDKDGCPDPDNDQDGILDPNDLCPNEPEDKNGIRDDDGCPDEILAVKTTKEIVITDKILFIHGQVIPRKISRPILVAVKDILVAHPRLYVQIEGHTDDYGGSDFNRYLSQARAQAVLDGIVRLSGRGQSLRSRLTAVGFGKDKPAATNETKEGRAKNRRVIFRIMSQ